MDNNTNRIKEVFASDVKTHNALFKELEKKPNHLSFQELSKDVQYNGYNRRQDDMEYIRSQTSMLDGSIQGNRKYPTIKEILAMKKKQQLEEEKEKEQEQLRLNTEQEQAVPIADQNILDENLMQAQQMRDTNTGDITMPINNNNVIPNSNEVNTLGSGRTYDKIYRYQIPDLEGGRMVIDDKYLETQDINNYPDAKKESDAEYAYYHNKREEMKRNNRQRMTIEGAIYK